MIVKYCQALFSTRYFIPFCQYCCFYFCNFSNCLFSKIGCLMWTFGNNKFFVAGQYLLVDGNGWEFNILLEYKKLLCWTFVSANSDWVIFAWWKFNIDLSTCSFFTYCPMWKCCYWVFIVFWYMYARVMKPNEPNAWKIEDRMFFVELFKKQLPIKFFRTYFGKMNIFCYTNCIKNAYIAIQFSLHVVYWELNMTSA